MFLSIIVLFFLNHGLLRPETPIPNSFDHPGSDIGLDRGHITAVIQDESGLMWMGTDDGLLRFDGYDLRRFTHDPDDPGTLSDNHVTCLATDDQGILWIGTRKGLNRFELDTNRISRFFHQPGNSGSLSNDEVLSLCFTKDRELWVGTVSGLNRLRLPRYIFKRYFHNQKSEMSINHDRILSMVEDSSGSLWIGTPRGLNQLGRNGIEPIHFLHSRDTGANEAHPSVNDLLFDGVRSLWIATTTLGLVRLDIESGEITRFQHDPNNPDSISMGRITKICLDADGRIWAGFHGMGLDILDRDGIKLTSMKNIPNNPESLSYNIVSALFLDRSATVWVGTYGMGINLWNSSGQKFRLLRRNPVQSRSLGVTSIRAIFEDVDGNIWVGGYSGLDLVESKSLRIQHLKDRLKIKEIVRVVIEDRENPDRFLWFGCESGDVELILYDRLHQTVSERYDFRDWLSVSGIEIHTLYDDGKGGLWCGTSKGLLRWDKKKPGQSRWVYPVDGKGSEMDGVLAIIRDDSEYIWAGTTGNGLIRVHPQLFSFVSFHNRPGSTDTIANDYICSLALDKKKRLWVGTAGGGLNRFDLQSFHVTRYSKKDGMPSQTVYGVLCDEAGNLWLSTRQGLSRFDPEECKFRNYDVSDGLQSNEFNANAYHQGKSGYLYFGGISGLNFFKPDNVTENHVVPGVLITDFQISNRSVSPGQRINGRIVLNQPILRAKKIILSHKDDIIGFTFSTLNYFAAHKNRYAYRMDGFDAEWHDVGNRRFAIYTNLPPGDYRFRVRGSNNDGVWNLKGASVFLHVNPPFWMTWWFLALSISAVATLTLGAHRARTSRIERRNRELTAVNRELKRLMEERWKAEDALRISEEKYRTLTDNINAGIYRSDPKGKGIFLELNPMMVKIFGYEDREEMLRISILDLYPTKKERNRFIKKISSQGYVQNEEVQLLKKDGNLFWCSVTAVAVRDVEGETIYYDGLVEDISERKKLESQLLQTQKMDAIGQLAGGVAHDFNNILTVIIGQAELGLIEIKEDHPLKNSLTEILRSGHRARDLISQLLAFSRRQIVEPKIIDINRIIGNLGQIFHRLIGEDVLIRTNLVPELPRIKADPSQIETIFLNLVLNARDAIYESMASGGKDKKITIETDLVFLDERYVDLHPGCRSGHYVMMAVSDTGIGMTANVRDKIFEPFFTTKSMEKGTGLGLSSVFGIVKQNHGHIYVYSEPYKGTTFKIYWPVSKDQDLSHIHEKSQELDALKGMETILIVEDEDSVREFLQIALVSFGYKVVEARNGLEALEILKKEKDIQLIITDVVMPRMGGKELAKKAKKIHPDLRVLYSSGYTDNHILHEGELEPGIHFIQKPFSLQVLAEKVRNALDNK